MAMADVLRNGIGYFAQGVRDCLRGIGKIYEFQKSASEQCGAAEEQNRPLSVLAQRRAATVPVTAKKVQYVMTIFV